MGYIIIIMNLLQNVICMALHVPEKILMANALLIILIHSFEKDYPDDYEVGS